MSFTSHTDMLTALYTWLKKTVTEAENTFIHTTVIHRTDRNLKKENRKDTLI